jgi:hypothetical protein
MGKYCSLCDDKVLCLVTSTACECSPEYCDPCWKSLFASKAKPVEYTVYRKKDGKFVKLKKTLYEMKKEKVFCKSCHTEWKEDECEYD